MLDFPSGARPVARRTIDILPAKNANHLCANHFGLPVQIESEQSLDETKVKRYSGLGSTHAGPLRGNVFQRREAKSA